MRMLMQDWRRQNLRFSLRAWHMQNWKFDYDNSTMISQNTKASCFSSPKMMQRYVWFNSDRWNYDSPFLGTSKDALLKINWYTRQFKIFLALQNIQNQRHFREKNNRDTDDPWNWSTHCLAWRQDPKFRRTIRYTPTNHKNSFDISCPYRSMYMWILLTLKETLR